LKQAGLTLFVIIYLFDLYSNFYKNLNDKNLSSERKENSSIS